MSRCGLFWSFNGHSGRYCCTLALRLVGTKRRSLQDVPNTLGCVQGASLVCMLREIDALLQSIRLPDLVRSDRLKIREGEGRIEVAVAQEATGYLLVAFSLLFFAFLYFSLPFVTFLTFLSFLRVCIFLHFRNFHLAQLYMYIFLGYVCTLNSLISPS